MSRDPKIFKQTLKTENDKPISFRMAALLICKTLKLQSIVISRKDKRLIKNSTQFKEIMAKYEQESLKMAPKIDGRILCTTDNETEQRRDKIFALLKNIDFAHF
jgi:hypothetical protein